MADNSSLYYGEIEYLEDQTEIHQDNCIKVSGNMIAIYQILVNAKMDPIENIEYLEGKHLKFSRLFEIITIFFQLKASAIKH